MRAARGQKEETMTYRIHFTWPNGDEDSFVVSGDTIEECQQKAHEELAKRSGGNPWSEEL